jgi:RNA polymerase sigma factor (sigma-70 family)
MDDWQLLRSYVERNSETAFRTLLNRYLDLVHSAALRQLNHNSQLAEEVAQAVFILLARKAGAGEFGQDIVLSAWLFRTTRFVSLQLIRSEKRRQQREQEALRMQSLSSPDEAWQRISPLLDEGLEALKEKERSAILLRFFHDKTLHETAHALGINEEAAKKRVARALEKLKVFFERRGFKISVVVLGTTMASNAVQAAPAALAGNLMAKVVAQAAVGSTALPIVVQQTLSAWRLAKLKLGALGFGIAVTAWIALTHSTTLSPLKANSVGSNQFVQSSVPTNLAEQTNVSKISWRKSLRPKEPSLRLHVVAADNGEPVTNAHLLMTAIIDATPRQQRDLITDGSGVCGVPYPRNPAQLEIGVLSPGWVAQFVTWRSYSGDVVPAEYTLKVERTQGEIGGWIQDESGQPVAGATISIVFLALGGANDREPAREHLGCVRCPPIATSDPQGRWRFNGLPNREVSFYLEASHPDYPKTQAVLGSGLGSEEEQRWKRKELWAGTFIMVLKRGHTARGRVLTEAGNPIAGAIGRDWTANELFVSDIEGQFVVPKLKPGAMELTVSAEGFAPEKRKLEIGAEMKELEFRLKPGSLLRVRVLDQKDVPVPDATVGFEYGQILPAPWKAQTDEDGRAEWRSAPPDIFLELYAKKEGYCYTRNVRFEANGKENIIRLQPVLTVTVHVTDADTAQPIKDFKAYPCYGDGQYNTWRNKSETRHGNDGVAEVRFTENKLPWRLRVEAENYAITTSDPLPTDFNKVLELRLDPANSKKAIRGIVTRPNGEPAVGAEVALCTFERGVALSKGRFSTPQESSFARRSLITRTDGEGRFTFAPNQEAHTAIAVDETGFARVRLKDTNAPLEISLFAWGQIGGTVDPSIQNRAELHVYLSDWASGQYGGGMEIDQKVFVASVSSEGTFTMDRVPPGNFYLLLGRTNTPASHQVPVTIQPGQTSQVQIGGDGYRIVGTLDTSAIDGAIDWPKQTRVAHLAPKNPARKPVPKGLTEEALKIWEVDFWQSEAGHNRLHANRDFRLVIQPDGSFQTEDVPPGTYTLSVYAKKPVERESISSPDLAYLQEEVIIPEPAAGNAERVIDLGIRSLRKAR